jgi:hypothetical protein
MTDRTVFITAVTSGLLTFPERPFDLPRAGGESRRRHRIEKIA